MARSGPAGAGRDASEGASGSPGPTDTRVPSHQGRARPLHRRRPKHATGFVPQGPQRRWQLIPAPGEFAYATEIVRREGGEGETSGENVNAGPDAADLSVALDRLEACAPKVESVSLVVAWFGDDLRAGHCRIRPGVEVSAKSTTPENWSVDGVSRAAAHLVSRDEQGRPAYGGTPADSAVVQAIQELKARGYRVTFYPFILMDVAADNEPA